MDFIKMLLRSFQTYEIIYSGPGVSIKDIYGADWRVRKRIVDKYHFIFSNLLKKAKLPWFDEFAIVLFYSSKHDPDNTTGLTKCLIDAFKQKKVKGKVVQQGYAEDDSSKYWKGLCIVPDQSLPHNTFKFVIVKIK